MNLRCSSVLSSHAANSLIGLSDVSRWRTMKRLYVSADLSRYKMHQLKRTEGYAGCLVHLS